MRHVETFILKFILLIVIILTTLSGKKFNLWDYFPVFKNKENQEVMSFWIGVEIYILVYCSNFFYCLIIIEYVPQFPQPPNTLTRKLIYLPQKR